MSSGAVSKNGRPTAGIDGVSVSFAGCGFLGIYHVGVASALREYAPDLFLDKVTGASAGAIAACGLICNMCLGQATSDVLKIVTQSRQRALGPLHPSFNLMKILRQGLRKNLPPDAHKMASGRLYISLTRFSDGQNVLVSQFDSKEELIQALICSAFIPFYCGTVPPMFKGVRYIDGGWSDNLPLLNENTVTVSPFSGESDICPQDLDSQSYLSFDLKNTSIRFTSRNFYRFSVALFPPHPEIMSAMCREGFEDALRFLAKHSLISCARCIEVRSSILLDGDKRTSAMMTSSSMDESEQETDRQQHIPQDDGDLQYELAKSVHAGLSGVKSEPGLMDAVSSANTCRHKRFQSAKSFSRFIDVSETECESCRVTQSVASKKGLPQIVKQTLTDAEASERTLFKYLMDFKPIKWLRYLAIPWLLPLDIAYALGTKFLEWLPSLPEDSIWFASKASDALSFILKEIEQQRRKTSSRLTCQMAITDLNYTTLQGMEGAALTVALAAAAPQSLGSTTNVAAQATSATTGAPPVPIDTTAAAANNKLLTRRQSLGGPVSTDSSMTAAMSVTGGQCTVTELNFGFSVDLQSKSSPVRQMNDIVSRDDVTKREFPAAAVACAAEDLEMEGLRKASTIGGQASPVGDGAGGGQQQDNFDTYAAILNFTHKRDALMSYYYMDENNQIKVTKIFGCDPKTNGSSSSSGEPYLMNAMLAGGGGAPYRSTPLPNRRHSTVVYGSGSAGGASIGGGGDDYLIDSGISEGLQATDERGAGQSLHRSATIGGVGAAKRENSGAQQQQQAGPSGSTPNNSEPSNCKGGQAQAVVERTQSFGRHHKRPSSIHYQKPRAHSHSRRPLLPAFAAGSSGTASESETEQLFVPDRRRCQKPSSTEEAYEAGDSSE